MWTAFIKPKQAETLTDTQAHWLLKNIVHAFRLALQKPAVDAALGSAPNLTAVLGLLEEAGLKNRRLRKNDIGPDSLGYGPVIAFIDGKLSLVSGNENQGFTILSEESQSPVVVTELPDATAYIQVARTIKLDGAQTEAFGWHWFSKEFFADRAVIRDVLIGSLFLQLIALAFPLATQAIVDKVIATQATSTLIVLGVGIFLMALLSAGFSWLRQYFLLQMSNVIDKRLSLKVLTHLFRLPIQYFEHRATGNIINRVHVIEPIREFVAGAFMLAAIDMPFMLIFAVLMVSYAWQLSLVVAAFLAVMSVTSFLVGPRLRAHALQNFQLGAQVQGFLTEQVAAAETVKSLQLENSVQRRFGELNNAHLEKSLQLSELGNRYSTFMSFMEQTMNATVLCLGAYLAMQGSVLTIGMLVAFQMFAQRVTQPILKLSGLWQQFQQIRISVAQLGDIMNMPQETYSPLATTLSTVKGALSVENLAFRYSSNDRLLYENLTFEVNPGEVVLITGPSGCGKSTLTKIMQGLYHQTAGVVKLDGRDIRTIPVNELRSYFGVVPQESVLFTGTILDNLLEAVPTATLNQVQQACELAGIHAEITAMPKGYQTEIGERGCGLSGGQRQRLAVARALLKRPRVLVFDESTSGLDEASSDKIAETINALQGKATVLFIAHKVPRFMHSNKSVAFTS